LHDPPVSHFAPFSKQRLDFPQQFCIAIAGRCQESNAFLRLLFHAARERQPQEGIAFLAAACDGDAELLREVESLL
jgi:hypothetical protein